MGQIIATCIVDNCFAKQCDDSGGGDILLDIVERDFRLIEAKERRAQQKFIQNVVHEEFDKGISFRILKIRYHLVTSITL